MANLKEKKSSGDIDVLKQRFNQLQGGAQFASQNNLRAQQQPLSPQQFPQQPQQQRPMQAPQQPLQQRSVMQQQQPMAAPPPSRSAQFPSQQNLQQPQQQRPVQAMPQQSQQGFIPQSGSAGRSPLEALNNAPQAPPSNDAVQVVEVEGEQNNVLSAMRVEPGAPMAPNNQAEEVSAIDETLETLKDEYDDAKLNSIIIDQVKELIEIDNNLNAKIEDIRVDFAKEVEERKKYQKVSDDRYAELKELEKSIEKFIALYEVVTNQYNPFVKHDGVADKQRYNELVSGTPPEKIATTEFESKSGHKVKTLRELIVAIESMTDAEYAHHVDVTKNDFAVWVFHSLKDKELAEKIAVVKKKDELLSLLKSHK